MFFRKARMILLVVNWTSLSLMSEGGAEKGWPRYVSETMKSMGCFHLKLVASPASSSQDNSFSDTLRTPAVAGCVASLPS